MLKVLKATEVQFSELNNAVSNNDEIQFTKDGNDEWIISTSVLSFTSFSASIMDLLNELEEIDYVQPTYEEI